ncbi:MAG: hypothetical protein KH142_09990, partial [Slackia piriformis]|nr:hypothetical protein [Slackia piriformis]
CECLLRIGVVSAWFAKGRIGAVCKERPDPMPSFRSLSFSSSLSRSKATCDALPRCRAGISRSVCACRFQRRTESALLMGRRYFDPIVEDESGGRARMEAGRPLWFVASTL